MKWSNVGLLLRRPSRDALLFIVEHDLRRTSDTTTTSFLFFIFDRRSRAGLHLLVYVVSIITCAETLTATELRRQREGAREGGMLPRTQRKFLF